MVNEKSLYTLIHLDDFKALLSIDDREDRISRFCLVTSTLAIEQYCKRRLLRKKHFERIEFYGDLLVTLREYPVSNVLAVYTIGNREWGVGSGDILETEFYRVIPDCGSNENIPYSIEFSPAVARMGCKAIKVIYWGGYSTKEKRKEKNEKSLGTGDVPADLQAACLELAAWNLNRYRGRYIGMNVSGGKEGGHFEMSMLENVRTLLEPYRRKVI